MACRATLMKIMILQQSVKNLPMAPHSLPIQAPGFLRHSGQVMIAFNCLGRLTFAMIDRRTRIFHHYTFHLSSSWQNHVPDHYLGRKMPSYIRSRQRPQSHLSYKAADPSRRYCYGSLEGPSTRSMGCRRDRAQSRGVDFQEREEG